MSHLVKPAAHRPPTETVSTQPRPSRFRRIFVSSFERLPHLALIGFIGCIGLVGLSVIACGPAAGSDEAGASSGAKSASPSGEKECQTIVSVASDQEGRSFQDKSISTFVAIAPKKNEDFLVVTGNSLSGSNPLNLWLGIPRPDSEVTLPLIDGSTNYLTLNLIGDEEFSAYTSHKLDRDSGTIEITRLTEDWIEARVDGLLSTNGGDSIEVEMTISHALPPARCP